MTSITTDQAFIRQVNNLALESAQNGFDPFAGILVSDGKIVAQTKDKCIQYSDPTAHAELILISEYCRQNNLISLEGHTLYCNVEPCVMCSGAIHWSRITRLVFGVRQAALQTVSKGKQKPACFDLINTGKQAVEIIGPVLEQEGIHILRQFPFSSKKEKHRKYHGGE